MSIVGPADARPADGLAVDLPAVLRRVRALRDHYVAGVLEATADLGERNLAGRATLLDAHTVQVGDRVLKAKRIILATGARPVLPEALSLRYIGSNSCQVFGGAFGSRPAFWKAAFEYQIQVVVEGHGGGP